MKIYAVIAADGTPAGFYNDSINTVPDGAVRVTEADWRKYLGDPSAHRFTAEGVCVQAEPRIPSLAQYKADLKQRVAAKRYELETGGVTVNNLRIDTDRPTQAMLNATVLSMQSGMVSSIDWKGAHGWITLGLTELTPIAQAVVSHVQACFTAERRHCEAIDALTEVQDYNIEAGW